PYDQDQIQRIAQRKGRRSRGDEPPVGSRRMFHTLTWVIWLIAAAAPAFTLRNPLYLILIIGASRIVYLGLGQTSPVGRSWGTFVRIGLLFVAVAVAFNAMSSHFGTLILFR